MLCAIILFHYFFISIVFFDIMFRKNWTEAFQELEDMEYDYEIFTRKSTTIDSFSDNGWDNLGVFDYEKMNEFISKQTSAHKINYSPKISGSSTIYLFERNNEQRERYFQVKVTRRDVP